MCVAWILTSEVMYRYDLMQWLGQRSLYTILWSIQSSSNFIGRHWATFSILCERQIIRSSICQRLALFDVIRWNRWNSECFIRLKDFELYTCDVALCRGTNLSCFAFVLRTQPYMWTICWLVKMKMKPFIEPIR